MNAGIVLIDMHIRDERVMEWIKQQASYGYGEAQVSGEKIAEEFKCHANTGRAILKRLISAQRIEIVTRKYQGGFVYKVKCEQTRTSA